MSEVSTFRIDVPGEGAVTAALHPARPASGSAAHARAPVKGRSKSATPTDTSNCDTLVVLAPGAGTSMENPMLIAVAAGLAARQMTVMRFNFLYAERGSKRPDPPKKLLATYRAAADALRMRGSGKLVIGGKSMGGRMASMLAAEGYACDGLVFLGYPLHPAGRPEQLRDAHLPKVQAPMLFVQGTRDALCDLDLLRPVLARVGARASLHVVSGADHSFDVRKSDGRSPESVLEEVIGAAADWIQKVVVG